MLYCFLNVILNLNICIFIFNLITDLLISRTKLTHTFANTYKKLLITREYKYKTIKNHQHTQQRQCLPLISTLANALRDANYLPRCSELHPGLETV